MSRLQSLVLLGVVAFAAFYHWGPAEAAGVTAALWLFSPHGPRIG